MERQNRFDYIDNSVHQTTDLDRAQKDWYDKVKKDAFGKISLVIPLGSVATSGVISRGMLERVSVRDQLYEPVERENRIRVVKISAGSVVVSGF